MKKRKVILLSSFLLFSAALAGGYFFLRENRPENIRIENAQAAAPVTPIGELPATAVPKPKPLPVSMARVRTQGCVADGLLSEYNPDNEKFIALVNRSNCYYLHRAIETWLAPPDFAKAEEVMAKITKRDVVYGMFIAEAISLREDYYNLDTGREFDFKKMCKDGSKNVWGEGTCKPDFASKEYRNYLKYITHRAIDSGVQSFTFGQIYLQESARQDYAPRIVEDMRAYAASQGVNIIIGAQTGHITDEKYLKLFDYIEGGVGIDSAGRVENGPCLSKRGGCWALLWHPDFATKANNVLLHLDWTGIPSDDLDIFARMDGATRAKTLRSLHQKFSTPKTGFLMPLFGVLYKENNGCRGPKKKFYSPDNAYSCKDEAAINAILGGR